MATVPLPLTGTVSPADATYKEIIWAVDDAGATGATISNDNTLNTTSAGTVKVRATITDGSAVGEDYTYVFDITITEFVITPVTGISGVPEAAFVNTPLLLTGTVSPADATYKEIIWTVDDAGTTGAVIDNGILTASAAGTVKVRATIANGSAVGEDYTEVFDITITEFVITPVTGISGVPAAAFVNTPLPLTGTVSPADATYKEIIWAIDEAGTTGATISNGNTLNTTAAGTVKVRATITDGSAVGEDYTQVFEITINVISVTGISGVPEEAFANTPLPLTGTVSPASATYKTIIWTVDEAGTTGATISNGNTLNTTAAGTVKVRATITNGVAVGEDYTQVFDITVSALPDLSGHIRFAWWGNNIRDQRTHDVIDLFKERFPAVSIETQIEAFGGGYWNTLATQAAAANLPDLIQQDVSYIVGYADFLEDLQPFIDKGIIDTSRWPQASLGNGTVDGKLVGLLLGTNALAMGVDPAVLQSAGVTIDDTVWSWEDYEVIALQIYKETGVQTHPAFQIRHILESIAIQTNSSLFSADGKTLGIEHNTDALNALRDYLAMELRLKEAGALYAPEDAFIPSRPMADEPLVRGKTWNSIFWNNQIEVQQTEANRPLELKMLPSIAGNSSPGIYLRSSMYISMSVNSTDKELAAWFINFFINDIEANRILLGERGIPVPSDVRADIYTELSPGTRYAFDYIDHITTSTVVASGANYPPFATDVEGMLQSVVKDILLEVITLDAGLEKIITEANAILNR